MFFICSNKCQIYILNSKNTAKTICNRDLGSPMFYIFAAWFLVWLVFSIYFFPNPKVQTWSLRERSFCQTAWANKFGFAGLAGFAQSLSGGGWR